MDIVKGAFITNRYYTDAGMDYAYKSFAKAFAPIPLIKLSPTLIYDKEINKESFDFDFAIFWDKDFYLAKAIENLGIPIFNNSYALTVCDDKQKTYLALKGIEIPKTISAPLLYDVNNPFDEDLLKTVENELGYPLIVKANTGSQGRQVYMVSNADELKELYERMKYIPHHYQKLTGEFGSDIRVYTVGGKAIAACSRQNTSFKSNLACGGTVSLITPGEDYIRAAENISSQLKLDFGAVDFLIADTPIFLEVNSNAYFTGIESLGVNIAERITDYIKIKLADLIGT